jgi:hypothetical protein
VPGRIETDPTGHGPRPHVRVRTSASSRDAFGGCPEELNLARCNRCT